MKDLTIDDILNGSDEKLKNELCDFLKFETAEYLSSLLTKLKDVGVIKLSERDFFRHYIFNRESNF